MNGHVSYVFVVPEELEKERGNKKKIPADHVHIDSSVETDEEHRTEEDPKKKHQHINITFDDKEAKPADTKIKITPSKITKEENEYRAGDNRKHGSKSEGSSINGLDHHIDDILMDMDDADDGEDSQSDQVI